MSKHNKHTINDFNSSTKPKNQNEKVEKKNLLLEA